MGSEKKKVAIILDHFCQDPYGSALVYPKGLLTAMADMPKDNIEITLVGFNFSNLGDTFPFLPHYEVLDIPLRRFPFSFDLRHFVVVPLTLRRKGFDVVLEMTQSIPFFFKKYGLAGLVTDITPLMFPRWFNHPVAAYLRHATVLRLAFKRCDRIAAISESTKRDLALHYRIDESKISVIPLAFNRSEYPEVDVASRFDIDGRFILSVGTVQPRKNYPNLIRAFDLLVDEMGIEDLSLVIVGKLGWKYGETIDAYSQARNRSKIRLLHDVADEELMNLYEQCLFFVYPSLYEGFGIPILEAMAFGKAVLISDNSAMSEFPVDDRFKIEAANVVELKEKMRLLVDDEALRQEQGTRNAEIAEGYSWTKSAKILLDFIVELTRLKPDG